VSPEAPKERRETAVWYVYFLKLKNDDIYVGSTNDLRRRFNSHRNGNVVSTRKFLPVVLSSYVAVQDEIIARKLEISNPAPERPLLKSVFSAASSELLGLDIENRHAQTLRTPH
jgi:putative endonuclease